MKLSQRAQVFAECDICGIVLLMDVKDQHFITDEHGMAFLMRVDGYDLSAHLAMHEICTCLYDVVEHSRLHEPSCTVHDS